MFCRHCGNQLPEDAVTCNNCGNETGIKRNVESTQTENTKIKKKNRMPIYIGLVIGVIAIVLFGIFNICIIHEWQDATCTKPVTCSKCGKEEGDALGHNWKEATCEDAKTCSVCNETEGIALGHNWQKATCKQPKICSVCEKTEGNVGEHTWVEATCQKPKTCTVCNKTEGKSLSHSVGSGGKCTYCGKDIGKKIDVSEFNDYFTISHTGTAHSPCTITIEAKNKNYKYVNPNGVYSVSLVIDYTYKGTIKVADTEAVSIKLDNSGCGSVEIDFHDSAYALRYKVSGLFGYCITD